MSETYPSISLRPQSWHVDSGLPFRLNQLSYDRNFDDPVGFSHPHFQFVGVRVTVWSGRSPRWTSWEEWWVTGSNCTFEDLSSFSWLSVPVTIKLLNLFIGNQNSTQNDILDVLCIHIWLSKDINIYGVSLWDRLLWTRLREAFCSLYSTMDVNVALIQPRRGHCYVFPSVAKSFPCLQTSSLDT